MLQYLKNNSYRTLCGSTLFSVSQVMFLKIIFKN